MIVSVIIAAFNAGRYLDEQLDALAVQTYQGDAEILVCDNGSTDNTRSLVVKRATTFPQLRLVDASGTRGAGHARNVGVREAAGELVAFCDADDVVSPGWLQALVDAAADQPVVVGRIDTSALNPTWTRLARDVPPGIQESTFLPFAGGGNLAIWKDIFLAVGGFRAEQVFLEDVDLTWRLQLAGHRLAFEPEAVIQMRLRRTLRGLYGQGFHYGQAFAQLERQYQVPPPAGRDHDQRRRSPVRMASQLIARAVTHPGLGSWSHLLWQSGWHLGHRAGGRMDVAPAA